MTSGEQYVFMTLIQMMLLLLVVNLDLRDTSSTLLVGFKVLSK